MISSETGSATTNIHFGEAGAGRDIVTQLHTNVQVSKSQAFDEILLNFLVPSSNFLGDFFAEFLRRKLTEPEKANIYTHMETVKETIGLSGERETSSKKFAKFGEWAAGAAEIDPEKQPNASAAWRAALDEIISQGDYRMLNIVNNLQIDEITSICDMKTKHIHDSNLGDRLKSFGIARRELIEAPDFRRSLRLSFFLISTTAVLFVLSEVEPLFRDFFYNIIVARLIQVSKWAALFVFIIYTIYAVSKNFDKLSSYILTDYGIRIADKIKSYLELGLTVRKSTKDEI